METRKELSGRKGPNVDRISNLPDSILSHILSFLPTKSSAATSILARRWRFLWADVPNIDLDFQSYCDWNKEGHRTSDIINIINRILFLGHNLKALNTFRLKLTAVNWHQLETWIAAVIARGKVQNIELEFDYCLTLPECLFTYKSLIDLRLYKCEIIISEPASICFPCLEKLHLCYVEYNNDETFQHLISGCSILEELRVIKSDPDGTVSCRIFSPTLKRLTVNFQLFAQGRMVEIITPALRYLHVRHSSKNISAQSLSSVSEADIRFSMNEYDEVDCGSVLEFLDRMSNVKCLKFDIHCRTFYHSAFSVWSPRFHNLTKLELAAGWRLISKFLEMSDNLQVLVIDMFGNPELAGAPTSLYMSAISPNKYCNKKFWSWRA